MAFFVDDLGRPASGEVRVLHRPGAFPCRGSVAARIQRVAASGEEAVFDREVIHPT
jgi:hypothetical protein